MLPITDPILHRVPYRIVLTGGPCAGKSTVLDLLKERFARRARFMDEVASMLLTHGYPQPGRDVEFSGQWLRYINEVILPTQTTMENGHLHAASEQRKSAVFFDRALLDPAAYLDGGKEALRDNFGLDIEQVMKRYTHVIHLESVACVNVPLYRKLQGSNPARYDTAEQARERDLALREAWSGHPKHYILSAKGGIDDVVSQVMEIVSPLLDVEIERKWLLPALPRTIESFSQSMIEQYYLRLDDGEMRLRDIGKGVRQYLTVKGNGGLKRDEFEVELPRDVFERLKSACTHKVEKRRYYVAHGGYTLEIDDYECPGGQRLYTMECEFNSELEAAEFTLPEWAEGALDVTNDPAYKNINLASAIR